MLTPEQHAMLPEWAQEALERAEAATEGPWIVHPPGGFSGLGGFSPLAGGDFGIYTKPEIGYGIGVIWGNLAEYENNAQNNAAFIAHARTDIPRLCAALALAVKALEQYASGRTWRRIATDALAEIQDESNH